MFIELIKNNLKVATKWQWQQAMKCQRKREKSEQRNKQQSKSGIVLGHGWAQLQLNYFLLFAIVCCYLVFLVVVYKLEKSQNDFQAQFVSSSRSRSSNSCTAEQSLTWARFILSFAHSAVPLSCKLYSRLSVYL